MARKDCEVARLFLTSCQNRQVSHLQDLVRKYNIKDWISYRYESSGDTPIHVAARCDRLDILQYLYESWNTTEIEINIPNKDGKRPLHEAAQFGHSLVAEYLLQKGAKVDSLKRADWTPLMLACTKDGAEALKCVKTFLEAGANALLCNKDGWMPLHLACRTGDVNIVRLLLQHSPDAITWKSKNGRTALHIAAFHGCLEVIEELLSREKSLLTSRDSSASTALHESAKCKDIRSTKLFVDFGADVTAIDNVGQTILHVASVVGNVPLVEYILENELVEINLKTVFGATALDLARKNRHEEVTKLLENYKA